MPDTKTLGELASMVRCKSAGPCMWTFEVMFNDWPTYERVKEEAVITKELISSLYKVEPEDVRHIINYDPANTIKITVRRPIMQGAPGDSDGVGAQQFVLLAGVEVPWD